MTERKWDGLSRGVVFDGCYGVEVTNCKSTADIPFEFIGSNGIKFDNNIAVSTLIDHRKYKEFLSYLEKSQLLELKDAVTSSGADEVEAAIKGTMIGKWLAKQNFVDWASLGVAVASLCS